MPPFLRDYILYVNHTNFQQFTMTRHIGVFIVDNREIFRQGVWYALGRQQRIETVGDCANAEVSHSRAGLARGVSRDQQAYK